jgi:hypothetical protein
MYVSVRVQGRTDRTYPLHSYAFMHSARTSRTAAAASGLEKWCRRGRRGCDNRMERICLPAVRPPVCVISGATKHTDLAELRLHSIQTMGTQKACLQNSVRRSAPPAQGSVPCTSFSVNTIASPSSASMRCTGTSFGHSGPRCSGVAQCPGLRHPSCVGSGGASSRCEPGRQPKPPCPGLTGASS